MRRAGPILIVVVGLLAFVAALFPVPVPSLSSSGEARNLETKLGLDLTGGLRIEYQVLPAEDKAPGQDDLSILRQIILNRVDKSGVAEPTVVTQGSDRIVVEMPGVRNFEQIESLIGTTGRLDFMPLGQTPAAAGQQLDPAWLAARCENEDDINCVLFSGDQIAAASIGADQNGQRAVDFTLNTEGKDLFAAYTAAHINDFFAIVLDGEVISAPTIISSIPNGQVQITQGGIGGYPLAEAQNLVTILQFGQLPFPIQALSRSAVSPTLGDAFLQQSLLAGAIAVLMVIVFMVVHYRLPGILASGALIYYAILMLALFRIVPVTLTLAGVAGFVLSVGMAVDANILIFERTKEELRVGKTLPAAIEAGFNRAWNSILDSNVSSLITAMILFLFGSSIIRGFGLVLIIGVLVSMFTAITVTRSVLRIVVAQPWARKAALYGVTEEEFLARPPSGRGTLRGEARGRV